MKTIFLDTNIFMHCDPPDQIPWLEVFETDRVEIIVPMIVVDELDRHKDNHQHFKLKRRALERLKQLEAWSLNEPEEIRKGVKLALEIQVPTVDFEALGLEKSKPDHLLIASMVQFRDGHDKADIVLVAHDTGPRLTARRLGFKAVELPEDYRLTGEPDPLEKENRELKQKMQRFENALPKLSLAIFDGLKTDSRTTLTISQVLPFSRGDLESFLEKTRAKHPFMRTLSKHEELARLLEDSKFSQSSDTLRQIEQALNTLADSNLHSRSLTNENEIKSYNESLSKFYALNEEFYRQAHRHRVARGLTAPLYLALVNEGTKPGEDVDIYMHFPDGFSMYLEGELPKPPKTPVVPTKPWVHPEQPSLSDLLRDYTDSPLSRLSHNFEGLNLSPSNVSVPEIKKTNSYDVNFHVERIKHNVPEKLPTLYLTFDSFESASNFTIDYELKAANLPDPVTGKLHVVLQKEMGGSS